MTYIYTAEQQKKLELCAASFGQSEAQLMENAGGRAFVFIRQQYEIKDAVVPVLCGSGGNGGDGLVVARMLKRAGAKPLAVLCSNAPGGGAAALMYKRAVVEGVPIVDLAFDSERIRGSLAGAPLIVDAVFGIGFHGELDGELAALFAAANDSPASVVSLDLPSGLNCDTGLAAPGAVRADVTLCFVGFKPAHVMKAAAEHCGRVELLDIGVPKLAYEAERPSLCALDRESAGSLLRPKNPLSHKGTAGRLLLVCGSDRYRGAATLAAKGALRAGAGIITVASSEKVLGAVAAHCPEAILLDINAEQAQLGERLETAPACLLGCGLGLGEDTRRLLEQAIKMPGTLVLDADGINALAQRIELLKERAGPTILTPHLGEFARLYGLSVEAVAADRLALARQFAVANNAVTVLKSENTVVALPDGRAYVNTAGNAGLAKAGSGDLLAGIIAGYAAMGKSAADSAALGVYIHSAAADCALEAFDPYCMVASDVARYITKAVSSLLESAR